MFRNCIVYQLDNEFDLSALLEALPKRPLLDLPTFASSLHGWTPASPAGDIIYSVGRQHLIRLTIDAKVIPASAVRRLVERASAELEKQQGFKPGRKQLRDIKEKAIESMLPNAPVKRSAIRAWIDQQRMRVVVETSSIRRADEFISLLRQELESLKVVPLATRTSARAAMSQWLLGGEPTPFYVDDRAELRSDDGETVRYLNATLRAPDVRQHVEHGKSPRALGMMWRDRVTFTLCDNLTLKRIASIIPTEQADASTDAFEADFLLMTGELGLMLDELIEKLGGLAI